MHHVETMGMSISFHPSSKFKAIKLIEALDDVVKGDSSTLFAQVLDFPKLFAVFVYPAELSFHNFENIVPLDRWVESKMEEHRLDELSFDVTDMGQVHDSREIFTYNLSGTASQLLMKMAWKKNLES